MGKSRMRLPVAWKTPLAIAAATPTIPISPSPLAPSGLRGPVVFFDENHLDLSHISVDLPSLVGNRRHEDFPPRS